MIDDPDAPTSEILREEQARLFGHIVGTRVAVMPVLMAGLVAVALYQPYSWQSRALLVMAVAAPAYFLYELLRYRKRGVTANAFARNLTAGVVGQVLVSAATGGLLSPFIYPIIPLSVISGFVLEGVLARVLLATQFGAVWVFAIAAAQHWPQFGTTALVPEGSQSLAPSYYYYHAAFLSFVVVAVNQLGRRVNTGCSAILGRHHAARHELLKAHSERVRELTSLSAEIAHELKNPLASVKGLSALLAQNIVDAKGQERLSVLRREVDRMQSVLEEFLNFSRPLVPLSIVACDVGEVVQDVIALHEGLAQQRGITLEHAESEPAPLRCDPRKVKQILINLVQNALDASPTKTAITLTTVPSGANVVVLVADEGAGVQPGLNLFDPGVTSKAGGAGLGLTIARSLARQHGGELTLTGLPAGGALATLTLPTASSATSTFTPDSPGPNSPRVATSQA
jgi:signal transduction histidine kinase